MDVCFKCHQILFLLLLIYSLFFNLVNYIDKFPNGELTLKSWDKLYSVMCSVLVTQSCLTLCDPMDCSPPGSSVHGIFQARTLEWAVTSSSKGYSWPRDWTHISCTGRWILHHWVILTLWPWWHFGQKYFQLLITMALHVQSSNNKQLL